MINIFCLPLTALGADFKRQVSQQDGKYVYTVNARAPHLYMISRDLYGSEKYWDDIAAWNNLAKPYALEVGQKLNLKKAPTLDDAEADRFLISAWEKLNRPDMVKAISANSDHGQRNVAATEEATPAVVAAPVAEPEPEPTPAVAAPTPAAEAPKTEATHEEAHETHHKKWHFGFGVLALMTDLDSDWEEENSHSQLYSNVDFGIEAKAEYHATEKWSGHVHAAVEHLKLEPGDDGLEIEDGDLYLMHLAAGLGYHVNERFALDLSYHMKDEPLVHPTITGSRIDKLTLPQLTFGPRFGIVHRPAVEVTLGADYLYSFPKEDKGYDLDAGQGYEILLDFAHPYSFGKIVYGIKYRFLQQDSPESKDFQRVYSANLGVNW